MAAELLRLNKEAKYTLSGNITLTAISASEENAWQKAKDIYRRLAAVDSPEIRSRYTAAYSVFLQNAVAILKREGRSAAFKEASARLQNGPNHLALRSPQPDKSTACSGRRFSSDLQPNLGRRGPPLAPSRVTPRAIENPHRKQKNRALKRPGPAAGERYRYWYISSRS